jgi:hypothetical protein
MSAIPVDNEAGGGMVLGLGGNAGSSRARKKGKKGRKAVDEPVVEALDEPIRDLEMENVDP